MPRKANPDTEKIITEDGKTYYKSMYDYSKNYDKNETDALRIRVPKGMKEKIQKFVAESDKYNSVNDFVNKLIMAEIENRP